MVGGGVSPIWEHKLRGTNKTSDEGEGGSKIGKNHDVPKSLKVHYYQIFHLAVSFQIAKV